MSNKALQLSNTELELTQRFQMMFPRGVIPAVALQYWNGRTREEWEKEITPKLVEMFSLMPAYLWEEQKKIPRLLSGGEVITIPPCIGMLTIVQAVNVFNDGIDSAFKEWGLDQPMIATNETTVVVYESEGRHSDFEIAGAPGVKLNSLCLTQHQIIVFCVNHVDWLSTIGATSFLLEVGDQFFVAYVRVGSNGLCVRVSHFKGNNSRYAGRGHRLVVPAIK